MSLDRQTDDHPSPLTSALLGIPGEISDGCFSGYPVIKQEKRHLFNIVISEGPQHNIKPKNTGLMSIINYYIQTHINVQKCPGIFLPDTENLLPQN